MKLDKKNTALIVVDMQNSFCAKGGGCGRVGLPIEKLFKAIEPCRELIACARESGVPIVYTRYVCRADYADAGVPMLPVLIGDRATAWVILGHTLALVAFSLLPLAYGMGFIYLAGALTGGSYFIYRSIALVRDPGPKAALSNFLASFIQLGLLLIATIFDGGPSI